MTFSQQILVAIATSGAAFVFLSLITLMRQRHRRRRSVHWFAIFVLSAVIGTGVGIGLHLSGTSPLDADGLAVNPA
ncbi:MAG: hypothetical protein AAF337_10980 [Pseudomonadota bacterium]